MRLREKRQNRLLLLQKPLLLFLFSIFLRLLAASAGIMGTLKDGNIKRTLTRRRCFCCCLSTVPPPPYQLGGKRPRGRRREQNRKKHHSGRVVWVAWWMWWNVHDGGSDYLLPITNYPLLTPAPNITRASRSRWRTGSRRHRRPSWWPARGSRSCRGRAPCDPAPGARRSRGSRRPRR